MNSDSASINAIGIAERSAWEVGSSSDVSDDEDGKGGRGVGGLQSLDGERGGLLFERVDEGDEENKGKRGAAGATEKEYDVVAPSDEVKEEEDGEDPFGDFEEVSQSRREA